MPLGLLVGAVGGTPSGYWLSEEAYQSIRPAGRWSRSSLPPIPSRRPRPSTRRTGGVGKGRRRGQETAGSDRPASPTRPCRPASAAARSATLRSPIRPFMPFAIRGVLWDQGESGTAIGGVDQYTLMGALIRGWRQGMGPGRLPLPLRAETQRRRPGLEPGRPGHRSLPTNSPRCPSRARRRAVRRNPHPHHGLPQHRHGDQRDLGPGTHPVCKSGYGVRAARVALGMVYGRRWKSTAPFQSHAVQGSTVRVTFAHVGQGLVVPNGRKAARLRRRRRRQALLLGRRPIDGDAVVLTTPRCRNRSPFATPGRSAAPGPTSSTKTAAGPPLPHRCVVERRRPTESHPYPRAGQASRPKTPCNSPQTPSLVPRWG